MLIVLHKTLYFFTLALQTCCVLFMAGSFSASLEPLTWPGRWLETTQGSKQAEYMANVKRRGSSTSTLSKLNCHSFSHLTLTGACVCAKERQLDSCQDCNGAKRSKAKADSVQQLSAKTPGKWSKVVFQPAGCPALIPKRSNKESAYVNFTIYSWRLADGFHFSTLAPTDSSETPYHSPLLDAIGCKSDTSTAFLDSNIATSLSFGCTHLLNELFEDGAFLPPKGVK